MRWLHPSCPGRTLRLAYCLNLHPADDLPALYGGLETITLPLRDRLAPVGDFGVGLWLPAPVAEQLASPTGASELRQLADFLRRERFDPFTFNAFPYSRFQRAGLKADVYRPTWAEPERLDYTLAVARIAARLAPRPPHAHVSISTHPGSYGAWVRSVADHARVAHNLARAVDELATLEAEGGPRILLGLESEPLASAGDTRELYGFLAFARAEVASHLRERRDLSLAAGHALAQRHLGSCLDACHSAVCFEEPATALAHASHGGALAKLQFTSALALERPGRDAAGRAALLALAEPRFLHQVVASRPEGLLVAEDLPELRRHLARGAHDWLTADAWRCHFHVPVDWTASSALRTTRDHADRLLELLLAAPTAWTTPELHVEIETYTWDVLPSTPSGPGTLVDGLEREYRHVLSLLRAHGWQHQP